MSTLANPFLPALLLLLLALAVGVFTLFMSGWLLPFLGFKPSNPKAAKLTPYECGAPLLQDDARRRYSVKFYLTAVLFILFDVEVAFLLPWAVNFRNAPYTFVPVLLFVATLLVGLGYVWGKGALEWER
uniref:NADH-quinone oxidoreductase subunit A n=1 Tax=uncultured bacterium contig00001 TaxID=1181493 RepID=A0A806K0M8_9BACT|nr:NADH ubiquinone oxidoreductase chain A [uncultured bacterium contig00001]